MKNWRCYRFNQTPRLSVDTICIQVYYPRMAGENTTVMTRIKPSVKAQLEDMKVHQRETVGDVIERLVIERRQAQERKP